MAIGNNRAEQELNKLLAATLVQKEVIEPMEKIGWSHATPPAADYGTTPQTGGAPAPKATPAAPVGADGQPVKPTEGAPATPGAKADTPFSFNIEDFKNPVTGKYFDKYDSPAEAMKGLGHLANMAKTSFSERDAALARENALKAEMEKLRSTPATSPVAAPTPVPNTMASRAAVDKAREAYEKVLSDVADDGGVINTENAKRLAEAQGELSQASARFALAESQEQARRATDTENARWSKVNEYMDSKYPKASQFATEIGLHVQTDPLLAKAVAAMVAQGNEIEASELAWLSYERAVLTTQNAETVKQATEVEADLEARGQVRQDLKERALKDAGVVVGSPGGAGVHQNPNQASSAEEIERLAQLMKRSGEAPGTPAAAAWRHAVIGRFLPPDLFTR